MSAAISFVALRECSASLRTSSATTANPRPASPARAASMAAFSASKLVCSVMSLMTLMISEISSERSPSDLFFFAVACWDALENLGEVVEHVVDGVRDVAKRVVGDFSARGQIAARHLVDDGEQLGDA